MWSDKDLGQPYATPRLASLAGCWIACCRADGDSEWQGCIHRWQPKGYMHRRRMRCCQLQHLQLQTLPYRRSVSSINTVKVQASLTSLSGVIYLVPDIAALLRLTSARGKVAANETDYLTMLSLEMTQHWTLDEGIVHNMVQMFHLSPSCSRYQRYRQDRRRQDTMKSSKLVYPHPTFVAPSIHWSLLLRSLALGSTVFHSAFHPQSSHQS